MQLSGVSSLNTGVFTLLPVTILRYRSKAAIFAVIPGFQTCALPSPALRDNGESSGFKPVPLMC